MYTPRFCEKSASAKKSILGCGELPASLVHCLPRGSSTAWVPVDETLDLFLEPFQLFLFLGVLCLLHSPHMRWDVLSTIFTKTLLERTEINSS